MFCDSCERLVPPSTYRNRRSRSAQQLITRPPARAPVHEPAASSSSSNMATDTRKIFFWQLYL